MATPLLPRMSVLVVALLAACSGGSGSPDPRCGDGAVTAGEACDDGNAANGDGCDSNCTLSACGNGATGFLEFCDDGNLVDGDGCDSNCRPTGCGSGVVTAGEECDDGNWADDDACLATCASARCGDGHVRAGVEACDDGNTANDDGCLATCAFATCGDGHVWSGYENCDDGNTSNDDDCLTTCIGASCGDGYVQAGVEPCDDGNTSSYDACLPGCVAARCGDGWINFGVEACDDGNTSNDDACLTGCIAARCGDGYVRAGVEACDDGNAVETDGCTSACEVTFVCDAAAYPGGDRFAVDVATGACFVAYDGEVTSQADAAASCAAAGGHLVTITSAAEDAVVTSILGASQAPWIGASDDANDTDAVFRWVTGERWSYARFAPGEPDDDATAGRNGECLHLGNAAGDWFDTDCGLAGAAVGRICEFERCGDGKLDPGERCDDGNLAAGDGCTACALDALWFTEYVEGTILYKVLEIGNPLSTPIDLTGCTIGISLGGSSAVTETWSIPPQTVAGGDVHVVCYVGSYPSSCDILTNRLPLTFDGDDTLVLACDGITMDVIGQVGFDPGTEWGTGLTSTAENTLRRRCSVAAGDTNPNDPFDPAAEWVGYETNTFSDLGLATCAP